ncbi:MAG TPA: hypothetical protein VH684_07860 [Xanthobacteraceae bacterium]|jgi:glucose-1-phosphate cytidylyltransferase
MMPVFVKPILVRVMEIFTSQGHPDFILSIGCRKEIFCDYFGTLKDNWGVEIVDTGEERDTGSRVRLCRDRIRGDFFVTYIEADRSGQVTAFREKLVLHDHWINAGFSVMSQSVLEHWEDENLEREVFTALQRRSLLYTDRHSGFFKSMDTHKDQQDLERAFEQGLLPRPALAAAANPDGQ